VAAKAHYSVKCAFGTEFCVGFTAEDRLKIDIPFSTAKGEQDGKVRVRYSPRPCARRLIVSSRLDTSTASLASKKLACDPFSGRILESSCSNRNPCVGRAFRGEGGGELAGMRSARAATVWGLCQPCRLLACPGFLRKGSAPGPDKGQLLPRHHHGPCLGAS